MTLRTQSRRRGKTAVWMLSERWRGRGFQSEVGGLAVKMLIGVCLWSSAVHGIQSTYLSSWSTEYSRYSSAVSALSVSVDPLAFVWSGRLLKRQWSSGRFLLCRAPRVATETGCKVIPNKEVQAHHLQQGSTLSEATPASSVVDSSKRGRWTRLTCEEYRDRLRTVPVFVIVDSTNEPLLDGEQGINFYLDPRDTRIALQLWRSGGHQEAMIGVRSLAQVYDPMILGREGLGVQHVLHGFAGQLELAKQLSQKKVDTNTPVCSTISDSWLSQPHAVPLFYNSHLFFGMSDTSEAEKRMPFFFSVSDLQQVLAGLRQGRGIDTVTKISLGTSCVDLHDLLWGMKHGGMDYRQVLFMPTLLAMELAQQCA